MQTRCKRSGKAVLGVMIAGVLASALAGCADGMLDSDLLAGQAAGFIEALAGAAETDDQGGQRPDGAPDDSASDTGGDDQAQPSGPDAPSGELRLRAELAGDGAESGHAEYRLEPGREKFKVEVQHFEPGTYEIRINGVVVAEIAVGPLGTAEIEFDSRVEPDHVPLPDDFPEVIRRGDEVSVGGLTSGVF